MKAGRGILRLFLAMLAALVLTACSGLPTSGPVHPGISTETETDPPDFSFLPDSPQAGATPKEIVEGFIRAGLGPGANGRWDRAREFLAPEIQDTWRPEAGVVVDIPGDRLYSAPAEDQVSLSLVAVATVDANGAYLREDVGATSLDFSVARQDDGEWRITQTPDGVVLNRDVFPSVFHRYSLAYFDRAWQYLVPDVRWFPAVNAATRITRALIDGVPSPWLAEAVVTAVPEGVTARAAVPVTAGVAEVELSSSALATDPEALDRMLTQLTASLATAGVSSVDMTVGSAPLTASLVATRSTRVPSAPLVLTADGFGFLGSAGDGLQVLDGFSSGLAGVSPTAIQMDPDHTDIAVRAADGSVLRVESDGSTQVVDDRSGLIDPSIDGYRFVWSVPRGAPGALVATAPDGGTVTVAEAWPGAAAIDAMSLSRDGTRIVAVLTVGGRAGVWVAGVVRDEEGAPVRINAPVQLAAVAGTARGLAWLDDENVGVLWNENAGSVVLDQVIGGPSTTTTAAGTMVQIAGGSSPAAVLLRGEDGVLSVERGTNWQQAGADILVLATQQGMPQ